LWTCGHIVETVRVAQNPRVVAFAGNDLVASVVIVLFVVFAVVVWVKSVTYTDRTVLLRHSLDAVLVALGVVVLFWHLIVVPMWPLSMLGVVLASWYTIVATVASAALLARAWHRRDTGSRLLALSGVLISAGAALWAIAKIGPDVRMPGAVLMAVGLLVIPGAASHPSHRALVVVTSVVRHDRLAALAFCELAWGLSLAVLIRQSHIGVVTCVLAVLTLVLLFVRVRLVGRSERDLVRRLEVLAFTDPLTGCGNRRSLLTQLQAGGEAWLATIDLDGFKEINDQFGHDKGDEVLIAFVRRLRERLPADCHLARIGGDEFAAVLIVDEPTAQRLGEQIVGSARDPRYATVSASVGLARHRTGSDPAETLRDCDIALQQAKRSGKNRLAWLTPQLKRQRFRELDVAEGLRQGLHRVTVAYQPIVELKGERHIGVEALARWSHPELGEVPPAEFVPICERNGLISELGRVVMERVLAQLDTWVQAGTPRQVCINVSWLQLREERAFNELVEQLTAVPTLCPWLVLEVTESVFAEDPGVTAALARLRGLGAAVAVDDFGVGASTLTRLRSLPADILKIDRSLLVGVGTDPSADSVLSAICRLGHDLGLVVLAEGVEHRATSAHLTRLGVQLAQGYLFGRPMPAESLPPAEPGMGAGPAAAATR
jgi:diguanylate cyclase (GGDEF)-like protein